MTVTSDPLVVEAPLLQVEGLHVALPGFALTDVSLRVERGAYFVLLGPTGCGKTLFLETLCGLRGPAAGSVAIGSADVTHLDPARRRIGYVPQDHALFPFLSVRANVAFGLPAHGVPPAEAEARVARVLDLLGIPHLADRRPAGLSGGERQRVALGRALAIEPALLLLDEPLSAIDEGTRESLIADLRRLHDEIGTTTLHVCHNLEEALALADRLGVMRDGRLVQTGTPEDVLSRPADLFVAGFLRLRNLLPGQVRAGRSGAAFYAGETRLCETALPPGPATAVLPLERLRLSRREPAADPGRAVLRFTIGASPAWGPRPELRLAGPGELVVPGIFPPDEWPPGAAVWVSVPSEGVHVLPGA